SIGGRSSRRGGRSRQPVLDSGVPRRLVSALVLIGIALVVTAPLSAAPGKDCPMCGRTCSCPADRSTSAGLRSSRCGAETPGTVLSVLAPGSVDAQSAGVPALAPRGAAAGAVSRRPLRVSHPPALPPPRHASFPLAA